MAEHVEVPVGAKIGQAYAPPKRGDAALVSSKERVVLRSEAIHHGGEVTTVNGLRLGESTVLDSIAVGAE
jgi:hypothetical protein